MDISPKNSQEKAQTENIAAKVIAIDEKVLIAICVQRGFFLSLKLKVEIISETTIIPSVAKKDSQRPISNKAWGDIANIKNKAINILLFCQKKVTIS